MKKAKRKQHKNKTAPTRIHEYIAVCTYWEQQQKSQFLFSKILGFYLRTVDYGTT